MSVLPVDVGTDRGVLFVVAAVGLLPSSSTSAKTDLMAGARSETEFHPLRTPRAAAVAGVVFGVLFASSIVLLRSALPGEAAAP